MQIINPILSYPILLAYFIGADNYTWVYFRNGKRQLLAKPLVYFETRLPTFLRIHKTALINPAFVADVQPPPRPKMAAAVQLQDGTTLPVSRRRWAGVLAALQPPDDLDPAMVGPAPPQTPPPLRLHAVITGDDLLLTEHCLNKLGGQYSLQSSPANTDLLQALRQLPASTWPSLLLIDARTERTQCLLLLEGLKRDPQLRVIPVIWLNAPSDCPERAYELGANSVVAVSTEPDSFVRTLTQLFQYWLFAVQFPVYEA